MIPRIALVDDEPAIHTMLDAILNGALEPPRPQRLFGKSAAEDSASKEPVAPQASVPFVVTHFSDPGAARDALAAAAAGPEPFCLLLTDLRMPGQNGTWLIREARRIDPGIRLIVFSSYSDYSLDELTASAGNSQFIYLDKTVPPMVVQQAIRREVAAWETEMRCLCHDEHPVSPIRRLAVLSKDIKPPVQPDAASWPMESTHESPVSR